MYLKKQRLALILFSFMLASAGSCKKWDKHIGPDSQDLRINLMEKIEELPQLSTLAHCLKETSLDKVLTSSKGYTIWAPDNEAMKQVAPAVLQDTATLKAVLMNLISQGAYFTGDMGDTVRVPMLNGKRLFFAGNLLDSAAIEEGNIYVRNGVLHIIDRVVYPLPNLWDFVTSTRSSWLQNAYVSALNYSSQDPSLAVVDSIDGSTGKPVYEPGTGIVTINTFESRVHELSDEDSLFTYVLLTDDGFKNAKSRQLPFFKSSDPAISDSNACWNVVKDLAFSGLYQPGSLPDSLVSRSGVRVHVDKNNIRSVQRMSNGIVYIVDSVSCPLAEKVPICMVQGENPIGFSDASSTFLSKIFYRQRMNDSTHKTFTDIYLNLGSHGADAYVDYATNGLYTTKYKVYWVALNDFTLSGVDDDSYGTKDPLPQILQIGPYSDTSFVPTFNVQSDVQPDHYGEVYLGEYVNDTYDRLLQAPLEGGTAGFSGATRRLRLMSPEDVPSGVPHNLTVDYIKLVPEF